MEKQTLPVGSIGTLTLANCHTIISVSICQGERLIIADDDALALPPYQSALLWHVVVFLLVVVVVVSQCSVHRNVLHVLAPT